MKSYWRYPDFFKNDREVFPCGLTRAYIVTENMHQRKSRCRPFRWIITPSWGGCMVPLEGNYSRLIYLGQQLGLIKTNWTLNVQGFYDGIACYVIRRMVSKGFLKTGRLRYIASRIILLTDF